MSKEKLKPNYDDFRELEVSLTAEKASWQSAIFYLLRNYSFRGVIAIVTLIVVAIGFWQFDDTWGLVVAVTIVVAFSSFVILIDRHDGTQFKKTRNSSDESGDEPEGA